MKNETLLGLILLIIILLVISGLGTFMYFSGSGSNSNAVDAKVISGEKQNVYMDYSTYNQNTYSNSGYVSSPCREMYGGECFTYPTLENKRLEPCPVPRPRCVLCYQGLAQQKGEGHMDNLVKTRVSC
jgi:hypothetical protein